MTKQARSIALAALLAAGAILGWATFTLAQQAEPPVAPQAPADSPAPENPSADNTPKVDADEDAVPVAPQVSQPAATTTSEPAIPQPANPSPAPAAEGDQKFKPIADELEMFELLGADSSHFENVFPGGDLTPDEYELALKVMYALRKFTQLDIEAWADKPQKLSEHAMKQGELIWFTGVARRCEKLEPLEEQRARFEIPAFYRVEVLVGEEQYPVSVYSLQVPKAWPLDQEINERMGCYAALLKKGGLPAPALVFATQHIAWYSNSVLGDLGMDMALFDDVVDQSRLTSFDRECFYQLLAASNRAGAKELERRTKDELRRLNTGRPPEQQLEAFKLVDLIRDPDEYQGQLMGFAGTAKRAVKVRVSDPDIIKRFGIDHYYELEVFVDLGGQFKLYKDSEEVFRTYPAVFCVRQLPQDMPTGESIHAQVFIPGFFLKNWTYASQFSQSEGKDMKQMAPLLVGKQPLLIVPPEGNPYASVIAGGFFIAALAGVWVALWRFGRNDAKFEREVISKKFEPENNTSLNDLDLDVQAEPDFRHLS